MVTMSGAQRPPETALDHCLPFILSHFTSHNASLNAKQPLFVGINGVQGCGKTTLVSKLASTLKNDHDIETLVLSLDDLYLTHADQVALGRAHPENPLVQHRGQPGTHDLSLASALFASLRASQPTKIPQYDKSAFSGQGDRLPESAWPAVNQAGQRPVQLVILEGWAVGFRALGAVAVEVKRRQSLQNQESTLWKNRLEDLVFVDEQLKGYDVITDRFDVFIHLDAGDTRYVYAWRQEQEAALRALRGVANAMTVEQVVKFVDNYYPAYELYTDGLRSGLFMGQPDKAGTQLRLVIAKNRSVTEVEQI